MPLRFIVAPEDAIGVSPTCTVVIAQGTPRAVELLTESLRAVNTSGVAALLVEQDGLNALELADRAYVIDHGRVVKSGPAMSLNDPAIREADVGLS
jgi:branched-chain amino acid transport system ATP-binding protein